VIITGYQKDAAGGALVIPAKIEGYPVVAIRNADAYSALFGGGAAPITSIVFPDSITEISNAWGSNTGSLVYSSASVTSIVFPKNQQASQNQGARQ
jgi:hypothetical protein